MPGLPLRVRVLPDGAVGCSRGRVDTRSRRFVSGDSGVEGFQPPGSLRPATDAPAGICAS